MNRAQVLTADEARRIRCTSFTLDGESVVCGPDGVAIFYALHRHGTVSEAKVADEIVRHLESTNWKIEKGPPAEGHGSFRPADGFVAGILL